MDYERLKIFFGLKAKEIWTGTKTVLTLLLISVILSSVIIVFIIVSTLVMKHISTVPFDHLIYWLGVLVCGFLSVLMLMILQIWLMDNWEEAGKLKKKVRRKK